MPRFTSNIVKRLVLSSMFMTSHVLVLIWGLFLFEQNLASWEEAKEAVAQIPEWSLYFPFSMPSKQIFGIILVICNKSCLILRKPSFFPFHTLSHLPHCTHNISYRFSDSLCPRYVFGYLSLATILSMEYTKMAFFFLTSAYKFTIHYTRDIFTASSGYIKNSEVCV